MCDTMVLSHLHVQTPRVGTPPAVRRAVHSWARVWDSEGAMQARSARVQRLHSEMDRFDNFIIQSAREAARVREEEAAAAEEASPYH